MTLEPKDINWEAIKRELEMAEPYLDECGNKVKGLFLGSVLSLTPSGKYYTPWASANVSESEAEKDQEWWEKLEAEAGKHGLFIESGIGDPTDIIVSKLVEEKEGGGACRGSHKPKKR